MKASVSPLIAPLALATILGMAGISLIAGVSSFNQTRIMELSLLSWLCLLFLLPSVRKESALHEARLSTRILVGIFAISGLASALLCSWPTFALLDMGHYLLLLCAVIAAAALFRAEPSAGAWLVMALAIGSAIAVARLLTQIILTGLTGVSTPLLEWYAPYSNPRFFAQAAIWALPLIALIPMILKKEDSVRWHWLAQGVCAGLWMLLLWSGSRGAMLVIGLSLFSIWAFFNHSVRARLIRPLLTSAALGVLAWIATMSIVGWDLLDRYRSLSLARFNASGRELLIQKSFELMGSHPLLGIGPAQFSMYNFQTGHHYEAHPHNFLLQIAVEWGIPAALIFLVLACRFLSVTIRNLRGSDDAVAHALLLSLIASALLSLIDGPQIMPLALLCCAPCMGLLISRTTSASVVPGKLLPVPLIALASFTLLAWAMMAPALIGNPGCISYPLAAESQLPKGTGYDNPRFWVQGRIPIDPDSCLETGRYLNGLDQLQPLPPPTFP